MVIAQVELIYRLLA